MDFSGKVRKGRCPKGSVIVLRHISRVMPGSSQLRAVVRRAGAWRTRAHDFFRGENIETFFDLGNHLEVNAELVAHGVPSLAIDPCDAGSGPAGAARFILANLVCNPAVRCHYPVALQPGQTAPFIDFLCDGLSASEADNVVACFDDPPSEPVKRVLEVREDLRELYPFALTPRERRQFFAWLLTHGRQELGITAEGALWYLIELDETPDRGLIPSYLMNPKWQADQPLTLTAKGWPGFINYLQYTYSIDSRWLKRAKWRPTLPPKSSRGVNVLGHFRYASGLQEACAGVAHALELQGTTVVRRDLPVHFPSDWRIRERFQNLEHFETTLYVAAVNTFPKEYFRRSGLHMRPDVRRIAIWYWEVDRLPSEWKTELTWPSEVWAPTTFLADAYRKYVNVPVIPMLPGVALPIFESKPRRYFGLPDDKRLLLFSFDMGSVMERKNPLGLIEAYQSAFRADDGVHLCIKVSRGRWHAENLAKLKQACRGAGATLLDQVLPRENVLALFENADCYASLHRAEGLGLGMAESMLFGKPVVATAYSGNLDFMNERNSLLVRATTVSIHDVPPYPAGSVWAEPDLEHAAYQLRRAFDEDAVEIALRGQRETAELLSMEAAGKRMVERLSEIER